MFVPITNLGFFCGILAVSYLLGSCLFGTWFWRRSEGDPREMGMKNNGLVHLARGFGWARALLVSCLDIGKGASIMLLSRYFASELGPWLGPCALLTVFLGHQYPLFRPPGYVAPVPKGSIRRSWWRWPLWRQTVGRFAGGVGVTPLLGAFLVINPLVTLLALGCWVAAVYLWKYSAVANMVSVISGLLLMILTGVDYHWLTAVGVCALLIGIAYLPSLRLLARGKETRLLLFPGFSLETGMKLEEAIGPHGDFYIYEKEGSHLTETRGDTVPWAFFVHPLSPEGFLDLDPTIATDLANRAGGRERIQEKARQNPARFAKLLVALRRHGDRFDQGVRAFGVRPIGEAVFEAAGKRTVGTFIFIPFLTERFQTALEMKQEGDDGLYEEIMASLVEAAQLAYRLGARVLGLGAFTSIVSAGGADLLRRIRALGLDDLEITSGNTFTAAALVQGAVAGCQKMGKDPARSKVIMYGLGSVGTPASFLLAKYFQKLVLVARNEGKLRRQAEQLAAKLDSATCEITWSTDLNSALPGADVVVSAVGAAGPDEVNFDINRLDPGAVVVEGSRPFILLPTVPLKRPDCLFVEGAVLEGSFWTSCARFLAMGGEDRAFGCLMETILRAMDGSQRCSAVGVRIDPEEITRLIEAAKRYKVRLSGFRWHGRRMHFLAILGIRVLSGIKRWRKSVSLATESSIVS